MCLAVPMQIVERSEGNLAWVQVDGVRHQADLSLVEEANLGDYVIVHAGFAIEKLDMEDALDRIQLFRELAMSLAEDSQERPSLVAPPRAGRAGSAPQDADSESG